MLTYGEYQCNRHIYSPISIYLNKAVLDATTLCVLRSSPPREILSFDFGMLKISSHECVLKTALKFALVIACLLLIAGPSTAQTENSLDDSSSDPMKLFERGQNAHAKGELKRALEFYEEAIKVRPEFPEAEFQRGNALVSLKRFEEAEEAFKRAIALKKNWALPHANLGLLLVRLGRNSEAETALRNALKLDSQNELALRALGDIRIQAGDAKEALSLATKATNLKEAPMWAWILRAMAERKLGLITEATTSVDHVLKLEPENVAALIERAELRLLNNNVEEAIKDLRTAERLQPGDKSIASRLAAAYQRAGNNEEARKIAESAGLITAEEVSPDGLKVVGTPEEINAANSEDPAKARTALNILLEKNPRSAMLLARLGASYRTDDPAKSLDFYRRASEIQPKNPDYAVGYASALVQARRFDEASRILRRVISVAPDNYAAHANLATALYSQKNFAEAIAEYDWLLKKRPDLTIAYYFIAIAHDNLGEYPEALAAYETFLASAAAQTNQLEIDKVKLRLPTLRRQIQLGEGVKRKSSN